MIIDQKSLPIIGGLFWVAKQLTRLKLKLYLSMTIIPAITLKHKTKMTFANDVYDVFMTLGKRHNVIEKPPQNAYERGFSDFMTFMTFMTFFLGMRLDFRILDYADR